jgi:hypothetical protein
MTHWQERAATRKRQKRYQIRRIYYHAAALLFTFTATVMCTRIPDVPSYLGLGKAQTALLEQSALPLFLSAAFMGLMGLRRCTQSDRLVGEREHAQDQGRKGHLRYRIDRRKRRQLKAIKGVRGYIKRGLYKLSR